MEDFHIEKLKQKVQPHRYMSIMLKNIPNIYKGPKVS